MFRQVKTKFLRDCATRFVPLQYQGFIICSGQLKLSFQKTVPRGFATSIKPMTVVHKYFRISHGAVAAINSVVLPSEILNVHKPNIFLLNIIALVPVPIIIIITNIVHTNTLQSSFVLTFYKDIILAFFVILST